MLENGSDLHINERQKIRHCPLGLLKKSRGMYVNGAIIAMSYTHLIRIINNNNNRPPACTSFSYGTGNKVSRNDGLNYYYYITKTRRSEVTAHSSTSSCAYPHINMRTYVVGVFV